MISRVRFSGGHVIPDEDIGWVAGVIDLKGRIIYKNNQTRRKGPQITLAVQTTEREVVQGLSALTGTSPEENENRRKPDWMRKNCIDHCPDEHTQVCIHLPPNSRWTISGTALAVVLYNVLPYLRNKKDYPELLESLIKNAVFTGQGGYATMKALRRLFALGWYMPAEFEVQLVEKAVEQEVPVLS